MTSKEIFENEQGNTEQIRLHAEGLFWKAYERSAYACCTQLRQFKATKKYIKAMDGVLVSIGFPQTSLPTLAGEEQIISREEKSVVIRCKETIDEKLFEAWKNHLPLTPPAARKQNAPCTDSPVSSDVSATVDTVASPPSECVHAVSRTETVAELLRTYNLAEHTPMEAMLFISELKRLLSEH